MALDPLSLGVGAGAAVGSDAISYYANKSLARQAQANTQKNMRLQVELEDQSQANRILRYPQLLKRAGINPALAMNSVSQLGASAVSHSEAPAHMETESLSNSLLAGKQLEMQTAETDLLEAQTRKTEAEADKLSQEVAHNDTRDFFINSKLFKVLENIRDESQDEFTREFVQSWLDDNSSTGENLRFDYGALDAFEKIFFGLERSKRSHEIEELTNFFDRKVMSMQLENGAAAAVANLPKDQRKLMYKTMMQMDATISKLASDVTLNDEQKKALQAQVLKYGQEIQSMLHNDPVAMYNSGDIGSLMVKLGFDGAVSAAHGVGFGAGYAVGQKLIPGKSSPAGLSEAPVFKGSGFSPQKLPLKPKGQEPQQLKVHRLREELDKMKSDGTKYFKPEVYRKKMDELERAKYGIN